MTRTTHARIAGFTFLFYIAVGITTLVLDQATKADGIAARLAMYTEHAPRVRLTIVLTLLTCVTALTLAVSLYALTRDQDRDLAVLALCCRVGEGLLAAVAPITTLGMLWLASGAADGATAATLGGFLVKAGTWNTRIAAFLFAIGSTLFAWLFLRGRMIPVPLAWLGVVGSVLLVVELPLELAGFASGPLTQLVWIPVALFELTLGPWLLVKGVR